MQRSAFHAGKGMALYMFFYRVFSTGWQSGLVGSRLAGLHAMQSKQLLCFGQVNIVILARCKLHVMQPLRAMHPTARDAPGPVPRMPRIEGGRGKTRLRHMRIRHTLKFLAKIVENYSAFHLLSLTFALLSIIVLP